MKILTAARMREVDRLTTQRYGLPASLLMENAAARTVEAVETLYGSVNGKRALVICGKGNNGGDGAALARQLDAKGCLVTVILLGRLQDTGGEAGANFAVAQALASDENGTFTFKEVGDSEGLAQVFQESGYELYFDALLGTGLSRPVSGLYEQAITLLDGVKHATIIAVDIPSGLDSDSAELIGPAVRANLTVTFTAPKVANIFAPAAQYNGQLVVAPIGTPAALVASADSNLYLIEPFTVKRWLKDSRRTAQAHKGDAGKVLIIAGSRGKSGAAALAGEASMRAGAGLVTLATAQSAQAMVAAQVIRECMTEALAETAAGSVSLAALEEALALARERDVVAIGPGLGSSDESTRNFVRRMIEQRARPMVIDADGLNALVGWTENLQGSAKLPIILTPHAGEMARLVDKSIQEVAQHRITIAQDFATAHQVFVVLKGNRTLIATPDGEVLVNPTGNAGMATGGSGDVLTGILAGLLAQKKDDARGAIVAGVYLHGLAGDMAAAKLGTRAMIASDISRHLGGAFLEIGGAAEKP